MALITAQMRTDVAGLYAALFGRAPEADGLGYWVDQLANGGRTLAQVAQSMYDTAPARVTYPLYLTNQEIVTKFYQNVLGTTDTDGIAYWTAKLNAGESKGQLITELMTAVTSYTGTDAAALARTATFNNKVAVGLYYAVTLNGNDVAVASTLLTNVDSTAASVTAAETLATGGLGKTFALTTGLDTIAGTAYADSITADIVTLQGTGGSYTSNPLTALDAVDGGAGNDTMTVRDSVGGQVGFTGMNVTNVENLVVTTANDVAGNALSTTGFTGLTSETVTMAVTATTTLTAAKTTGLTITNSTAQEVDVIGGGGALKITNGAGAIQVGQTSVVNAFTSAAIKGGTTVDIRDVASTTPTVGSTLTSVTLDGETGAATLTGKGLTSVSVSNTTGQNVTITNATASHTETVTLNKFVGGIVSDTTATTVNLAVAGTKASDVDLDIDAATALNVSGAAKLTLDTNAQDYTALKTVAVANTAAFFADLSSASNLTDVNASTSTGANEVKLGALAATYEGGSGNDTLILTAAPTVAVSGGTGTDTLAIDALNNLATLTSTALSHASGFETLGLSGAFGAGGTTLTVSNLPSGMTNVAFLAGATAAAGVTVTAGAASTQLTFLGDVGQTVTYTQKTDTTNDSLTINLGDDTTGGVSNTLVASKIEHVTIASHGDVSTTTATNVLNGSFAAATTLTVTGEAGVDLSYNGSSTLTKLATIDGSAHNAFLAAYLTSAASGSTVTSGVTVSNGDGGAYIQAEADSTHSDHITLGSSGANYSNWVSVADGNNVITTAGADTGMEGNYITAGNGNNTITIGDDNGVSSSYVTVGDGDNVITLGNAADTSTGLYVVAGDGDNTITLGDDAGTGSSYVNVGDGNNTIVMGNYSGTSQWGNYIDAGNGDNTITVGDINSTATSAYINVGTGSNTITTGDGDYFVSVTGGGTGVNTITTGAGANVIVLGDGGDTVDAGAGADTITAGLGKDTLTGGAGADIFVFNVAGDSQGVVTDTITDFTHLSDKIQLDVLGTGTFLGTANGYGAVLTSLVADNTNGHAVFDTSTKTLYVDVNGDGQLDTNDMAINLTGVTTLTSADFTFV
jgi:Ca2+-binding RTX toxin-like protein